MNRFLAVACLAVVCSFSRAAQADGLATFENPILPGFHPDPSICRAGDDYYLVSSTFEYFPGVPIFHSQDLIHWRQIGHCLSRPSQLRLEKMRASGGIYAPTLRFHDGTFYMVTTNVGGGGNFYVTATDPAGPWSDPVWVDREGIDPSLFVEDDGSAYYMRHVGGGDGYIGQQLIDLKSGKLAGELKEVWHGTGGVWPEGPHLYKRDGRYYIMIAEGGTSYRHKVTIARSDSPWGPFESCPQNPILTHENRPDHPLQALGHADLVETPSGWWAVCLGIRPPGAMRHHIGRETMLAPVSWTDDGWPWIGDRGQIEVKMSPPRLPAHPWPKRPSRDDFDSPQLAFDWNFLRNPHNEDWSLEQNPGRLRLIGSAVTMSDVDSPAFIGRRQTSLTCRAQACVDFEPRRDNEEAGLVIRGNDANHLELGIADKGGRREVFLRQVIKGKTVEPVLYHEAPAGPLVLGVSATPHEYHFSFAAEATPDAAVALGTIPTQVLASETIGGFTGAYFGMYATGNGQRSTAPADFEWFDYQIDL